MLVTPTATHALSRAPRARQCTQQRSMVHRGLGACPVQWIHDVRPDAAARFRIQFYAVCAARPIIEFGREQLMVRSQQQQQEEL